MSENDCGGVAVVVRYAGLLDADYLCAKHFTLGCQGDGDDVIDWMR